MTHERILCCQEQQNCKYRALLEREREITCPFHSHLWWVSITSWDWLLLCSSYFIIIFYLFHFWFRYEYIVPLFIVGFRSSFTSTAVNLLIADYYFFNSLSLILPNLDCIYLAASYSYFSMFSLPLNMSLCSGGDRNLFLGDHI